MPAGRPTKHTKELLKKALHYVEHYKESGDLIPTHAGLAVALDIRRETIYLWIKEGKNIEFINIAKKIMEIQEHELVQGGLAGSFNASITKLLLTKHGYSDKIESELTGASGGPIKTEDVNRPKLTRGEWIAAHIK